MGPHSHLGRLRRALEHRHARSVEPRHGSRGGAIGRGRAGGRLSAELPNGNIKHVIYIQFDNTHFRRDNPNVPSDLEQMPHLLNFIENNGTLLTNDHTALISHTATAS